MSSLTPVRRLTPCAAHICRLQQGCHWIGIFSFPSKRYLLDSRYVTLYITTMGHAEKTEQQGQAGYRFRGRLWLEGPDGTFLGYGRAVLLDRIRDYGSISAAARSMGMSYRHAWKLVDSMNSQAKTPLVTKTTGGRGGGGAVLTEAGERALASFWRVHEEFRQFMAAQTSALILE